MLSKTHRLKRGDVKKLFKKGKEKRTELFIIKEIENKDENPRFSVLISKKISPKAVKRNHLRRQIYEAIRLNIEITQNTNKDILLIPKKHISTLNYQEIEKGVCEMLESIRKIDNNQTK